MANEEEPKQGESFLKKSQEKIQSASEKASKAKKAFKIFMKLPTTIKIAILVAPIAIIILLVLFAGFYDVLDDITNERATQAKIDVMGSGTAYSDKVIKIENNKWKLNVNDELKKELNDAKIDTTGMTQSEMLLQLLLLHGLDTEQLSQDQIDLLPYLIKAELATQQVDLRNASEMYNSDGTYNAPADNSLDDDNIQGTVHFKRINTKDMTSSTVLSYIDYATFQSYNNDYNNAKKYFSFNADGDLVIYTWDSVTTETKIDVKESATATATTLSESLPEVDKPKTTEYNIQEIVIDYKSLISKYTLPYEVLTALLINSEDSTFTKQVAQLGVENNIEIGIMEEETTTTTKQVTDYTQKLREYTYLNGTISGSTGTTTKNKELIKNTTDTDTTEVECTHNPKHGQDVTSLQTNIYQITQNITSIDNTYSYGVLMADTWFVKLEEKCSTEEKITPISESGSYNDIYRMKSESDWKSITPVTNTVGPNVPPSDPTLTVGSRKINISCTDRKIRNVQIVDENDNISFYTVDSKEFSTNYYKFHNIIMYDDYGNYYMYDKDGNLADIELANTKYNLEQKTIVYSKTDSETKTNGNTTTWKLNTTKMTSDLYDSKGEKFLKAYGDNAKARGNIGSSPGWLGDMLDKYDPNFRTIIEYLIAKYNGKDVTLDSSILDSLNGGEFITVSSGAYGAGGVYDYIRSCENGDLYNFYKGKTVSSDYVDGNYYKVYSGGANDPTINIAYGIVISREYNDKIFENKGVSKDKLRSYTTDKATFKELTGKQIEELFEEIVTNMRNSVKEDTKNLNLNDNQIDALTAIKYQYGNIGNINDVYKYYKSGDKDKFKEEFKVSDSGYSPFKNGKAKETNGRTDKNWNVFDTGKADGYEKSTPGKLDTSKAGGWISGSYTSQFGKTFTIFNQNNISGWESNCNRAASISIVSGYVKASTKDLVDTINSYGNGIPYTAKATDYFKQYGLTITNKSNSLSGKDYTNGYKQILQKGHQILMYIDYREYHGKSGKKWATSAHWLAILDYNEQTGKIFVSDSGHGNSGWVNLNEFMVYGRKRN